MANIKLTIQHNGVLYEPPLKDEVRLELERTGTPGKLTFTVIKTDGLSFSEGDVVSFYYDNKKVFAGYVFTKKRDKEHHIEVTCYDQTRYLKNKYTYVFEKKTATQIIEALCKDFKLNLGSLANTKYVIPTVVEENISATDIIMSVLEETTLNTGNMFVLYDDFGKLTLKNTSDMVSTALIFEDSAENFDYTSSIDNETYTDIVLYYKNEDNSMKVFNAYSPSKMSTWGRLRYFEEIKNPSIGKNKANNLLNLYCRKTRELKITGAFGDISVRGGTLIPVRLNIGDISTNNFMLVEKVTHIFKDSQHTMDLTLEGAWEQDNYTVGYKEEGEVKPKKSEDGTTTPVVTGNYTATSGNSKADYILKTIVANGGTVAGACGVLANVEAESNFNTGALGDGGTSYGICQWHNERWTNLKSYCSRNGYNSSSIEGQTAFLIHELKSSYASVWSSICNAKGKQGARDTAYLMCVNFERPANATVKGRERSNRADKWWGIYGVDKTQATRDNEQTHGGGSVNF